MPKVILSQPLPPIAKQQLQLVLKDKAVVEAVTSLDLDEFARLAFDAEILVSGFRPVNAELLALAPNLRFVQQLGVGYNHLNLADLGKAGIKVANTPGSNTDALAEQTILLMLGALKLFSRADQMTRANKWDYAALNQIGIGDLSTAVVGLVGFGAIAQATARRLKAFGSRIIYTSRRQADPALEQELGVTYTSFPELLAQSTIVSLHLPLNEETRYLMSAKEFAQMKPGAILVNTARGGLVQEAALREAIVKGHLGGAALDVLENEVNGGNPFTDLPQVIVTPHIGGFSRAAAARTLQMAVANIARYLSGQEPLYLIPTE